MYFWSTYCTSFTPRSVMNWLDQARGFLKYYTEKLSFVSHAWVFLDTNTGLAGGEVIRSPFLSPGYGRFWLVCQGRSGHKMLCLQLVSVKMGTGCRQERERKGGRSQHLTRKPSFQTSEFFLQFSTFFKLQIKPFARLRHCRISDSKLRTD